MPNHYHFLLKQTQENGVSEFMHKLDTSYTMFFNLNNNRSGRLFESTFKAKMIVSDELLLHVSRYVHLNPVVKGLVKHPNEWRWSSYKEYFDPTIKPVCDHEEILNRFISPERYRAFVEDTEVIQSIKNETMCDSQSDEDTLFL